MADVYMLALPAAILLAAGGALWLYVRRSMTGTLLLGHPVFGLTDCVLAFLLYAPGVLGQESQPVMLGGPGLASIAANWLPRSIPVAL